MRLFDHPGAQYFCGTPAAGGAGGPPPSLVSLQQALAASVTKTKTLIEGTPEFVEFRESAMVAIERSLFYAASNYLRGLNLLTTSSAPWAHVTLYYGSFFAAKAILGMHGGFIDRVLVEGLRSTPGQQQLVVTKKVKSPADKRGSHQMFWDFYYDSCHNFVPWVADPSLTKATSPVSNNTMWQIESRNAVNYDTTSAWQLSEDFRSRFNAASPRTSLSGTLATQFEVTEATVLLAFQFARDFGLNDHSFPAFSVPGQRSECIRALIAGVALPDFVTQSRIMDMAT